MRRHGGKVEWVTADSRDNFTPTAWNPHRIFMGFGATLGGMATTSTSASPAAASATDSGPAETLPKLMLGAVGVV